MGCFSWLCKECGKGILSSSFDGQECILFLLKDGEVLEVLRGRYTSYGTVFKDGGSSELRVTPIHEPDPGEVKNNTEYVLWQYGTWSDICNLEFTREPLPPSNINRDAILEQYKSEKARTAMKQLLSRLSDDDVSLMISKEPREPKLEPTCGVAAFHKKCYKGVEPTTRSQQDPDQGWGENWEYFGSTGKVEDGSEACPQNTEKMN